MLRLESYFGQKLFSRLAWLLATFFTYSFYHSTHRTQICQSSTRFIHAILFGYQLYHYFLLRRHLLLPTRMSERHWIPWPISINGWTPRIFIFVRSKDNSTISFPRSTLKVPWTLLLRLLRMLIYIYIFLFLFNSFVLSNVYNSYALPFLWQKKKQKISLPIFNSLE